MTTPHPDVPPVPARLAGNHEEFFGAAGTAWIAALPALARERMTAWGLTADGPAAHGVVALVLPVRRADGTPAALKLQPADEETGGEPHALRAWGGRHAVRLLEHDPASGSLLLERLDAARPLSAEPDEDTAVGVVGRLLGELSAVAAPPGTRTLADLAAGLLHRAPRALPRLSDPREVRLLETCAGAVRELSAEPGGRLVHWDLHYGNVLAPLPGSGRPDWLAIDPKPLAGDPGFDLFPALRNRWGPVASAASPRDAVLRRFDLLTATAGLDRARSAGWTLGRVLQNALWDAESGAVRLAADQAVVATAMLRRTG